MIEMQVGGLGFDPRNLSPIVLLRDHEEMNFLPIWIGVFEANAIALTIENIPTPRPMTHDLMKSFLARLDVAVDRVVVTDVRNNTFYAAIHCRRGEDALIVDARPSDAIALALRTHSPIFVEDTVVRKAHGLKPEESADAMENLRKWLETLTPEEMGKYKM
jgi:bifunctional DNase/RNase